ncbi:hypothetical protein C0J52_09376 [Blattella germanica]|nr:hypothetical protein C0J52_09376 [Blattella germanica]
MNDIWCIEINALLGLGQLERLDLSYNKLTNLHRAVFNDTVNLSWLSLAGNKLLNLPPDGSFIHASALKSLDMSNCSVDIVHRESFSGLQSVVNLNLSHNNLKVIQPTTFHSLIELVCLDLSFNELSGIEINAFNNNTRFGEIICYDTNRTNSSERILSLIAHNNPWTCDCSMKDFYDWSMRLGSQLDIICRYPEIKAWDFLEVIKCITSTASTTTTTTATTTKFPKLLSRDESRPTEETEGASSATAINVLGILIGVAILVILVVGVALWRSGGWCRSTLCPARRDHVPVAMERCFNRRDEEESSPL